MSVSAAESSLLEVSKGSFFSNTMSTVSSAASSVVSGITTCFSAAMKGIALVSGSVSSGACRAITFSASVVSAHPRISTAAAIALGLGAAARCGYIPAAVTAMLSKK